MKFAVVGAGAIGGLLGAQLAEAGLDVTLVARGAHLDAMRSRGLEVIRPDGSSLVSRPTCTGDLAAARGADFTFVTVKAHSLPALAPGLSGSSTLVFTQNGLPWWYLAATGRHLETVDPGGAVAAQIDLARVIGCIAYPAAEVVEPGVIRHLEGNRFSLAEPGGSRTPRVLELSRTLAAAGLKAPVQARMEHEIWVKLLGNATFNPVSALTRATLGELLDDPDSRGLVTDLMQEVGEVAGAAGVQLGISVERRLQAAAHASEHRTSMLQDVESERPLEVDALVGSVVELGRQLGVPTPALSVVYGLTRQLSRSLGR
ncbi:MAG: oxidoreductase [Candidatus Nephthysia bennettiae]|uniref:2-dehydropantoate 2-reductase n=1 Tax=Candidatus Nephthysia bennettiae TaxID=3127016 RepID=A0A934K1K2_9BACT|nr:2-dehydropantoate 2-reductase [Candidatus Dormibacteraeota bacterium]MBJ7611258.1 2-dehydropantoate 2-reductase [Candidatus Dormibacteraeota bacterium]PZR86261.1 MAG: oxidoreductase [Candidatus Dormibacteraeota bacterium]